MQQCVRYRRLSLDRLGCMSAGVPLIPTREEGDVIVQKKSRIRHLFRGCYVQQCVRYRRFSLDGLHERGGPGDPGAGKSGEGLRRNTGTVTFGATEEGEEQLSALELKHFRTLHSRYVCIHVVCALAVCVRRHGLWCLK